MHLKALGIYQRCSSEQMHTIFTGGGDTRPQGGMQKCHGGYGQGRYASAMPPSSLTLRRYSHDRASSFFLSGCKLLNSAPCLYFLVLAALHDMVFLSARSSVLDRTVLSLKAEDGMHWYGSGTQANTRQSPHGYWGLLDVREIESGCNARLGVSSTYNFLPRIQGLV